jgi:hypothetical protein
MPQSTSNREDAVPEGEDTSVDVPEQIAETQPGEPEPGESPFVVFSFHEYCLAMIEEADGIEGDVEVAQIVTVPHGKQEFQFGLVGKHVLIGKNTGIRVGVQGVEHRFVTPYDIIAVVSNDINEQVPDINSPDFAHGRPEIVVGGSEPQNVPDPLFRNAWDRPARDDPPIATFRYNTGTIDPAMSGSFSY